MSEILRRIFGELTPISVMHKKGCSLEVSHRVTESTCYVHLHGVSPYFTSGHSSSDAEMHEVAKGHFKKVGN